MPQAVLEIVASAAQFDRLPFSIDQKSSRSSALILLALLVPALCIVFVPVGFLAAFAAQSLWIAAERPLAALQILAGLCICTVMFGVPAKRLVQRFGSRRSVRITERAVTVSDAGLFGSSTWSAPISEFAGIAHHVRATLSGLRHELILVHPARSRSVLIHAGDHMTKTMLERATTLLRLPEVPAKDLYRSGARRPQIAIPAAIATPQAQAA